MTGASVSSPWRRFLRTALLVLAISYAVPLASGIYVLAVAPDENFCAFVPTGSGPAPLYLPAPGRDADCKVEVAHFLQETGAMAGMYFLPFVGLAAWGLGAWRRRRRKLSPAGGKWLRFTRCALVVTVIVYLVPVSLLTPLILAEPIDDPCEVVPAGSGFPPFYFNIDEYHDCRVRYGPLFIGTAVMAGFFVLPVVGIMAFVAATQREEPTPSPEEP